MYSHKSVNRDCVSVHFLMKLMEIVFEADFMVVCVCVPFKFYGVLQLTNNHSYLFTS